MCKDLARLLDREMDVLQRKLDLLDGMAECVRRGFYQELETLLEEASELETESEELTDRIGNECRMLAAAWNIEERPPTLGTLLASTTQPDGIALSDRRERLVVLVEKVRESGSALGLLVEDALDINQRLLTAVIGEEDWTDTYGENGGIDRRPDGLSFEQDA
jgi:flagellar biosynthesis/type III secretory pathway chaperone